METNYPERELTHLPQLSSDIYQVYQDQLGYFWGVQVNSCPETRHLKRGYYNETTDELTADGGGLALEALDETSCREQLAAERSPQMTHIVNARYHIYAVANENCETISGPVIAATDDLAEAKTIAAAQVLPWGAAIVDRETELIDFGRGFGVAIEVPEI